MKRTVPSRWLLVLILLFGSQVAAAQSLPVSVNVAGNVATALLGNPATPVAELTLTFDDASNLSPSSLGISARLVDVTDPALLSRLPDLQLTRLDSALPLLITIEPPAGGGLRFRRTGRLELHTEALRYAIGSDYRVFKAPLGGRFQDTTEDIAQGSVRARSRYGGFSQFLIVADLRQTGLVVAGKIAALRDRVSTLPAAERPPFSAQIDAIEAALAQAEYADAIIGVDLLSERALARAGTQLADEWRATRDADNQAGELLAGAATLKYSIAYLRDFGQ